MGYNILDVSSDTGKSSSDCLKVKAEVVQPPFECFFLKRGVSTAVVEMSVGFTGDWFSCSALVTGVKTILAVDVEVLFL